MWDAYRMKLPLKKVAENIELNFKQIDILFKFTKLGKKDIFYDHYVPYLESHKNRAHIILEPD